MSKIPTLSQLNRDYQKLLDEIVGFVPNLTDDWTDFSEGDLGMFILRIAAAIKDMQAYHFDMTQLENYIPTVTQRQNLISIIKPFGYNLRSYKASRVVIRSDSVPAVGSRFVIADKTGSQKFVYLGKTGEAVLRTDPDTGDTYYAVTLYQGELSQWPASTGASTEIFSEQSDTNGDNVNNITAIAISDVDEKVAIDASSFLEINGLIADDFTEVSSFVDNINEYVNNDPDNPVIPKLYRLFVDTDNKTYLEFFSRDVKVLASNATSEMDLMNSTFIIHFLITDGAAGTVSTGTMLSPEGDDQVSYEVIEIASVGADPETVEEAREAIPDFVKTMDRAVSIADYTYISKDFIKDNHTDALKVGVSVVDYYKNVTAESDYQIPNFTTEPFKVVVYSVYGNGDYISDLETSDFYAVPEVLLLSASDNSNLVSYLDTKRMVGVQVYANSLGSVPYPCAVTLSRFAIKVTYTARTTVNVKAIREAIATLYGVNNEAFGRRVTVTEILNTIYGIDSNIIIDIIHGGLVLSKFSEPVDWSAVDLSTLSYSTDDIISKFNEALVFGGILFVEG